MKKLILIVISFVLVINLLLAANPAKAAVSIAITSPTNGSSATGTSFDVTGTATADSKITVKVNSVIVGSTISDGAGNWSVNVSGQSAGAKNIEATVDNQTMYTNVVTPSDLPSSHMAKINTITDTQSTSFNIISGGLPFLVWKPNSDFTKAYGTSPYLSSALVWPIDLVGESVSSFTMTGTTPRAASMAFNADGTKVYVADNENAVEHVYNTADNSEITTITIGTAGVSHPHGTIHRPGTNEIWETNGGDNEISKIDTVSDTVTATYSGFTSPNSTAFNADGSLLYVSNGDTATAGIAIVNPDTGAIVGNLDSSIDSQPEFMLLNSSGTRLYTSYPGSNIVEVFDTASKALVDTITVGTGPWGMALTSDDSKLYVANPNLLGGLNGTTVSVVDTSNNTVSKTINMDGGPFFIHAAPAETATGSISFTLIASDNNGNISNNNITNSSSNNDSLASTGVDKNKLLFVSFLLIGLGFGYIFMAMRKLNQKRTK